MREYDRPTEGMTEHEHRRAWHLLRGEVAEAFEVGNEVIKLLNVGSRPLRAAMAPMIQRSYQEAVTRQEFAHMLIPSAVLTKAVSDYDLAAGRA